MSDINRRWEDLNKAINNRQKELENALLRLGQFQHALSELLVWISCTDRTLDSLNPVIGDPQVVEVELAKLKVMVNDIQAHQSSVDTLNDAGRQILESEEGKREASQIQLKINELNTNWNSLFTKAENRQVELDDILREACAFSMEIQEMLLLLDWLAEKLSSLDDKTPVHGDLDTVKGLVQKHKNFDSELRARSDQVELSNKCSR